MVVASRTFMLVKAGELAQEWEVCKVAGLGACGW